MFNSKLTRSFLKKVLFKPGNDCWFWGGSIRRGYGRFSKTQNLKVSAHRFSYQMFVGEIPAGLVLDHKCRNRRCVNPEHLRVVSLRENILCGEGVAAINARKKNCFKGHPFSGRNLVVIKTRSGTGRVCRICHNEKKKKYKS